jgi:hypothetical protein
MLGLRTLIPVTLAFSGIVAMAAACASPAEDSTASTASALRGDWNGGGGSDQCKNVDCKKTPNDKCCKKDDGKNDDNDKDKDCDNDRKDGGNNKPPKGDDDDDDHDHKGDHGGRTW